MHDRGPAFYLLRGLHAVTLVAFVSMVCSCGTAPRAPVADPRAASSGQVSPGGQLTVLSYAPTVDTCLAESTVLEFVLDYHLQEQPHRGTSYGLMPFFEDKVGDGRAFSAVRDVGEVAAIAKVEGRADFKYSIRREFGDYGWRGLRCFGSPWWKRRAGLRLGM